jgi:hypothetical protein
MTLSITLNKLQHSAQRHSELWQIINLLCVVMLSVIMLNVTYKPLMLSVVMLRDVMMSVVILNVKMLNVIMLSIIMLSIIMLNVIILNVIILSVIMQSVNMLCVVMLSVIMLNVNYKPLMLNVVMLSIIMLIVIMLSVVMLSVVAPLSMLKRLTRFHGIFLIRGLPIPGNLRLRRQLTDPFTTESRWKWRRNKNPKNLLSNPFSRNKRVGSRSGTNHIKLFTVVIYECS